MATEVINLSEFNVDSLYNTFDMPRENVAARMVISQMYREILKHQKGETPQIRRNAALENTERWIGWNYPIFRSYCEDFAHMQPDIKMNALRVAILMDGFEGDEELFLPEDVKSDVREILGEARDVYAAARGVYAKDPSELKYKHPETAYLLHIRMMAELNDGERMLEAQDADDLCYLVGTSLYAFKKIVRTDMRIGEIAYGRIDKMEDDGVKILKDHPDVPKIYIRPLMLVSSNDPKPEISPSP